MTTATLTTSIPQANQRAVGSTVWLIGAFLISAAMLALEHDPSVSKYEGYVRSDSEVEATAAGGNTARRLASTLLGAVGLGFLLASAQEKWRFNFALLAALAMGLGWCLVSYTWAVDPSMCTRRLIVLGCYIIAALGLARAGSLTDLARLAVWIAGGALVLGLVAELALGTFRPWSGEYRFAGTLHPNAQGSYLVTLALGAWVLAENNRQTRWTWLGVFAIATVFLVLTKSRTSVAGLAVAMALVLFLRTSAQFKFTSGFVGIWATAATLLSAYLCGFDPFADASEALLLGRKEEAESFTGRSDIWREVLWFVDKHPWTGYGYESFWTQDHIRHIGDSIQFTVLSAHSGFLELILSVGIVGLLLFMGVVFVGLVQASWLCSRAGGSPYALVVGLLVFTLVCSWMESTMVTPNFAGFILAVGILHLATRPPESAPLQAAAKARRRAALYSR